MSFVICGLNSLAYPKICDFLVNFLESTDSLFDDLKITINSLCRKDVTLILNNMA